MRVATYYSNSDIRLEERPVPRIGPGELLVRVEASGICGTDVLEWYRLHKAPLVLGHEIAGEIVEVGEGVDGYRVGARVTAAHHVPCNTCSYCLSGYHTVCDTLRTTNFEPGGFSEFARLPAINVDRGVFVLPEGVSFEEATFVEPVACVLRGQRVADVGAGRTVLVLGSGISGLLHIKLARALGAGRVIATDISPYRIEAAKRHGADLALDAREDIPALLRRATGGHLADTVIICTGATSAVRQAIESVERGGSVLFFAPTDQGFTIPVPVNELFWRNEVTLTSSYAGSPADHALALELIRSRRLEVRSLITHRLGLDRTGLGFKLVAEAGESLKVIINPQE